MATRGLPPQLKMDIRERQSRDMRIRLKALMNYLHDEKGWPLHYRPQVTIFLYNERRLKLGSWWSSHIKATVQSEKEWS